MMACAGLLATVSLADSRTSGIVAGDTGFAAVHPIDRAEWIGLSNKGEAPVFTRFRKTFATVQGKPLEVDVSADERYVLLMDGKVIGR